MAEVTKSPAFKRKLARMVHPDLKPTAEKIKSMVIANAADHIDTGEFVDSIKIGEGKVDFFVYSTDPEAASKEFGHITKKGTRVEGMHAFGKAVMQK